MSSKLPKTAECVVIGGGVVGCSLAYHLAQSGVKALVLERGSIGGGSTSRGAGGVRQQFSTDINVRVSMLSARMLDNFVDEIGVDPLYRKIGYLFLATTDAEAEAFAKNVEVQQNAGLNDARLLTPSEAHDMVPELRWDDVTAATFCPSDGLAGPSEVTNGYAAAARRLGTVIVEDCAVSDINVEHGAVTGIVANGETVGTQLVVDCAGPYAAVVGKMANVEVQVKPYRRHIFVTESFSLGAPPPMTVDFHTSFYFHPEGDGLLLGMSDPAEPTSFDTSVAWDFLEHLVQHATWRVPALEGASIKTGWAGLYEVSPDSLAIVGEAPDLRGFWLCCGFSGHGFMQAPAIGKLLADQLMGRTPEIDLTPLSPKRFAQGTSQPEATVI